MLISLGCFSIVLIRYWQLPLVRGFKQVKAIGWTTVQIHPAGISLCFFVPLASPNVLLVYLIYRGLFTSTAGMDSRDASWRHRLYWSHTYLIMNTTGVGEEETYLWWTSMSGAMGWLIQRLLWVACCLGNRTSQRLRKWCIRHALVNWTSPRLGKWSEWCLSFVAGHSSPRLGKWCLKHALVNWTSPRLWKWCLRHVTGHSDLPTVGEMVSSWIFNVRDVYTGLLCLLNP